MSWKPTISDNCYFWAILLICPFATLPLFFSALSLRTAT